MKGIVFMIAESVAVIQFVYNLGQPPKQEDPTIYVGDTVIFYDDETGQSGQGVFEGLYCRLNPVGESSPYWFEHTQGIHRVRIREVLADGNYRPNYILVDNVYALGETQTYPN